MIYYCIIIPNSAKTTTIIFIIPHDSSTWFGAGGPFLYRVYDVLVKVAGVGVILTSVGAVG